MPMILDIKQSTGEKLRQLRTLHNLTMGEFGAIFTPPVSRSVVANWEANRNFPNTERLITISNYFDISTDFLLKNNVAQITESKVEDNKNIFLLPISSEENTYLLSLLSSNNRYDNFYLKIMNSQVWHILEECDLSTSISLAKMPSNSLKTIIDTIQKQNYLKDQSEVKTVFVYSNIAQQLVTEIIVEPNSNEIRKKGIVFEETLPKSQEHEDYPFEFFFEGNLLMNAQRNDHFKSNKHALHLPYLSRVLLTQMKPEKSLR